ncbi:MAG TPA: hypothetical protein VMR86_16285 [Myxococcota bacterium]|nr:hypothetical protein [Myxococcota bacterium]
MSLRSLALCLALAAALSGCKIVPLVEAPRMRAGDTPELTRSAIIRALIGFEYMVDEESPGRIRARYEQNSWTMVVDITYGQDVAIQYADSVGLGHKVEHDVSYIHRGYNERVQELAKEIQRQIMIASLETRPMPTASPAPPPPPTTR